LGGSNINNTKSNSNIGIGMGEVTLVHSKSNLDVNKTDLFFGEDDISLVLRRE